MLWGDFEPGNWLGAEIKGGRYSGERIRVIFFRDKEGGREKKEERVSRERETDREIGKRKHEK